jgi:hypothetical protein
VPAAVVVVSTIRGIGFLVLTDAGAYDLRAIEAQTVAGIDAMLRDGAGDRSVS